MFRRSILKLHSCRSERSVPIQITSQIPSFLSSRKAFSVKPQQNPQGPGSTEKSPGSGSLLPKILVGSVAVGAVSFAAYQTGYLDKYLPKEQRNDVLSDKVGTPQFGSPTLLERFNNSQADKQGGESIGNSSFQVSNESAATVGHVEEGVEATSEPSSEDSSIRKESNEVETKGTSDIVQEGLNHIQEESLPTEKESNSISDDLTTSSNLSQENSVIEGQEVQADEVQHTTTENTAPLAQENKDPVEHTTHALSKDGKGSAKSQSNALLDEYLLSDNGEEHSQTSKGEELSQTSKGEEHSQTSKGEEQVSASAPESQVIAGTSENAYIAEDGKLVVDFLQAIHAAEQRQAELDAIAYAAERKIMKEKYERELKDSRARELMYAEREAILEKELNKERLKAAAALKSLQEKLEDRHRKELEEQQTEAKLKEKKLTELAKGEVAAAIAREKASHIEKMAEANLHIDALCMAFYARSKEARHSHSVHKLALGALALEDTLSKGLPIRKEVEALQPYLEDIDNDSLLSLVISSLPKETLDSGTDTLLQLNHKFDALKRSLRHFSLIPPGGGGILAHSVASLASLLKVKEASKCGDGIEPLINRVESFLAEGKLVEAAETLEAGVKDTQAAEVVGDWVKRVRNRAIAEQALTVVQSYATLFSLTT